MAAMGLAAQLAHQILGVGSHDRSGSRRFLRTVSRLEAVRRKRVRPTAVGEHDLSKQAPLTGRACRRVDGHDHVLPPRDLLGRDGNASLSCGAQRLRAVTAPTET